MEYLDFEQPIKELMEQYEKCTIVGEESGVDVSATCKQIEEKINKTKKENLWQPYAMAESAAFPPPRQTLYIGLYPRNSR